MHLLDLNAPGSHVQSFINIGIACLERIIQKKRKKINSDSTDVLIRKQRENSQQVLRNFLGLCLRVGRAITIIHAFLSLPRVSKKLLLKRWFDFYVYNQFKVQGKRLLFHRALWSMRSCYNVHYNNSDSWNNEKFHALEMQTDYTLHTAIA